MTDTPSPRRSGWPLLSWLLLLVSSIIFGATMAATNIVKPASNLAYDAFSKLTAPQINPRVLIVSIDDESINRIGRWPWDRNVHAKALDELNRAGVDAIIYDVLFTEAGDTAGDAQLAQAAAQSRRLVVPFAFEIPGRNGEAVSVKLPLESLTRGGVKVGQAGAPVDDDGIARRMTLQSETNGALYRHVVPLALNKEVTPDAAEPLIAFAPHGATPSVPFAALVKGEIPSDFLKGKIVLVGATAAGLGDRFATPVSSDAALTSGVEILANVASNMLDKRFVRDTGLAGTLALLTLALVILASSFRKFEPRVTIFVVIGLVLLLALVSLVTLRLGLWIDPTPAIIALMLLFPAWGWQRLSVANRLIGRQLAILRDDSGILSRPMLQDPALDRLSSQLTALETGIERSIDLRRFIQSSFDSLPDPALVVHDDGTIALMNTQAKQAFEDYCGIPMPAKIADALAAFAPHVQSDHRILLDALHANAAQLFEIKLQDDRYYQTNVGYFRNARGDSFAIIRFSELTALRQAERQRQNALEFLSHDLRSPQSSMISLIDGNPASIETSLAGRLRALATRTLQLAQSFVDISRVQAGSYAVTENALHDVIQEALDALWPDLRAKGLKIKLKAPDEDAIVIADQLLLFRAITNLIHNAIKFSPQSGEIGITIRARKGANDVDGWACLIDDHGPGVARADQLRIFERFQSSSHATGGVGLGLSLVAAVAAGFGGSVCCVGKPGVGSRFILWLPKALASEAEPSFDQ